MSAEYILKKEERQRLEALAIGIAIGSQLAEAIEIDPEIFLEYNSIAKAVESEELKLSDVSQAFGSFSFDGAEDITDEVFNKLTTDAMLTGIYRLSGSVVRHGSNKLTLDVDIMKALRDSLNKYIKKVDPQKTK